MGACTWGRGELVHQDVHTGGIHTEYTYIHTYVHVCTLHALTHAHTHYARTHAHLHARTRIHTHTTYLPLVPFEVSWLEELVHQLLLLDLADLDVVCSVCVCTARRKPH